MPNKIGFYICHCGINIAGKVRVTEVADYVRGLKNVVVSKDYKFMCSDPGQDLIEKDIKALGLNRVVVASCSPRLHEKTFQGTCERSGLNPYFFQQASVREQVSWVTEDPDDATKKAKAMAAAAVNRVNFHNSLITTEANVHPDVLVVGAGITGMQAALDIAAAGKKVYLVERQPTIGGHMLQFDKTFPTLDCAACIGTPKMVSVGQNSYIDLLTYSEVKEVTGFIGNYKVKILRKPRYINADLCTGCGDCSNVCPVSRPSEWDLGLGQRKAIYRSFPQAVPITYLIEKQDRAPCVLKCPADINIQGYVQLIGQGKYKEAIKLIMEKLPLPGILGRVCPHSCEIDCRRKQVDKSVSIRELKRFAADNVNLYDLEVPEIKNQNKKIAVIGSGPSGLTCAYYLRLQGYEVTIFEALPSLGGMLKVGIPDYRLPQNILENEINYILSLGIKAETNKRLGVDFTLEDLKNKGYDAIFLGIGAHISTKLNIKGEDDFNGVLDAVKFLREVNLGAFNKSGKPGNNIAVIGGGNVAVDAARVAKRLGCENVTIVYRRTIGEMPAYDEEIQDAQDEGIKIQYLTIPMRIIGKKDKVIGLECIKAELGEPDTSGRRRPIPIKDSEFITEYDCIIPAIGQAVDRSCFDKEKNLNFSNRNLVITNPVTKQTSLNYVFSGGDLVTGPATVIEAVADGKKAADSIDLFLQGKSLNDCENNYDTDYKEDETSKKLSQENWADIPKDTIKQMRSVALKKQVNERIISFDEVQECLSEKDAKAEALRCLNCGVCSECMECVKTCEAKAIDHTMKPKEIEIDVGSIILATGYDVMDPTPMNQFGYGKFSNVFTSLEFERLNNATGPTGGKILMKNNLGVFTKPPKSIAFIHCVGSRDKNYHEYCSRVCCMYALKYGHLAHDKLGHETKVYDFYIDMRCFGKGYEEFYTRCQSEGINFVRGKPAEISNLPTSIEEKDKLIVIGEDTLSDMRYRIPVDMVVLCVAIEARADAPEVSRLFGLNQGADGFFLEEHPKLGPLNTPTDGVFLAGACQGPKDIPDTVAQASGAAVKSLQLSTFGKVKISPTISWIDPEICAGCQTCISLCAYTAIEFDEKRQISVINEAVCKGCGSCSGFCPSGAAQIKHFTEKQIFAELEGHMDTVSKVGIK